MKKNEIETLAEVSNRVSGREDRTGPGLYATAHPAGSRTHVAGNSADKKEKARGKGGFSN